MFGSVFHARSNSKILVLVLALGAPRMALAQAAAVAEARVASVSLPAELDTVRLRDGAAYRGVISEVVPGSHVLLVLATGSVHRFEASDVVYAGRSDRDEPMLSEKQAKPSGDAQATRPQPEAPVSSESLSLILRAPPTVAFVGTSLDTGSSRPARLCSGDCVERVSPGRYRFALAQGLGAPVAAPGTFELSRTDVLEASYHSARSQRVGGAVVLGVGIPVGLYALISGIRDYARLGEVCRAGESFGSQVCEDETASAGTKPSIVLGAVTTVAATALGTWLVRRRDRAEVHLRGLAPENREQSEPAASAEPRAGSPALVLSAPAPEVPAPPAPPAEPKVASDTPAEPAPQAPPPAPKPKTDAPKIAEKRAALFACFEEVPRERLDLIVRIDEQGKFSSVRATASLAAETQGCLEQTLRSVVFDQGPARSLRVRLTE